MSRTASVKRSSWFRRPSFEVLEERNPPSDNLNAVRSLAGAPVAAAVARIASPAPPSSYAAYQYR
jgi:hypothetical protein